MTFEGFDAALLIEDAGLSARLPGMGVMLDVASSEMDGALDAALRQVGQAERDDAGESLSGILDRAAAREELTVLDLWIDWPGTGNFRVLERHGLGPWPETSGLAWALGAQDDIVLPESTDPRPSPASKEIKLRAAFDDVDGDGKEDEPIVVQGKRPMKADEGDDGGWTYWGSDGNDGTGFDTGSGMIGGGDLPNQQTEDADDTPCVDEVPAGVDKEHLNDLAKYMGTRLAELQDSTGWEWGAVIYRAANGQLYQSEPFTARHPDDLNGALIHVPEGAHIVGYIHTHPIDNDSDQRMLSTNDREFINRLVEMTGSRTADVNMLVYITTKDKDLGHSDNYSTFVYDKSKRSATSPGCDL